ncbi:MAG TPA: AfsR/SARP family transcriptional regulator [Gaiellaceae bacterium]
MAEFFVLGPLEAVVEGGPLQLQAEKPRALLALLLLRRNRVVPVAELIDDLWGDDPPETATSALQVYVSQLRKAIGADRVLTRAPGYSVRVEAGELDLERFERLVAEGRELLERGEAEPAADRLREALALWRGPPFAEFRAEPFAEAAGARLEEARLAATELRVDADLALGRETQLVPELEELVAAEPYRERVRAQLMVALYRSGRQAEALELYRRTRDTFVDELGIEPGPELQELERLILRQDESLRAARPVRAVPAPTTPPRRRRLLVVAAAAAVVLAAIAVAAVARDDGGATTASDHELQTFVSRLENFLAQSHDGRTEITSSISAAFRCKLPPRQAAERLNRVQRNRQSLLQQVAALSVPDDEGARAASDLFQKAEQASIAADWHYRDWLVARQRCGPPDSSPEITAALAADRRATVAKRAFVAAFNPLARRVGQRGWTAEQF